VLHYQYNDWIEYEAGGWNHANNHHADDKGSSAVVKESANPNNHVTESLKSGCALVEYSKVQMHQGFGEAKLPQARDQNKESQVVLVGGQSQDCY